VTPLYPDFSYEAQGNDFQFITVGKPSSESWRCTTACATPPSCFKGTSPLACPQPYFLPSPYICSSPRVHFLGKNPTLSSKAESQPCLAAHGQLTRVLASSYTCRPTDLSPVVIPLDLTAVVSIETIGIASYTPPHSPLPLLQFTVHPTPTVGCAKCKSNCVTHRIKPSLARPTGPAWSAPARPSGLLLHHPPLLLLTASLVAFLFIYPTLPFPATWPCTVGQPCTYNAQ
jgi:hypothetical protein